MLRLIFLRHGKPGAGGLTEDGIKSVQAVSEKLSEILVTPPQRILTSPELRTIKTAQIASEVFAGVSGKIVQPEQAGQLSEEGSVGLMNLLHTMPIDVGTLLCVTHKPVIGGYIMSFSSPGEDTAKLRKQIGYGSAVILEFSGPWWEIERGKLLSLQGVQLVEPPDYEI